MTFQVCIDIGGTFTDCLVMDATGEISIFKAPTTPGEFEKGFIDVLAVASEGYGMHRDVFINEIDLIVHGSTVSTNALVEKKVVLTGILLNEGHKDVLTLREGPRKGAFEWRLDYPEPYIPARLTRTVAGRMDARGREMQQLDEAGLLSAVEELVGHGIKAVAICFLWSIVNPAHELRARELISNKWPDLIVTLSHDVNPMPREYKRFISAAIDASISPIIRAYVEKLTNELKVAGFSGELLLANCVGGMMPTQEIMRRPIYSVMSGPTLAPMAALALTEELDVIVGDMGGTTFDVSALRDRHLIVTPDSMIHDDALGIPKVDVRSVGAGGGSIASVDAGGLLRVGPQSAGARPGPACYGLGGTHATVTDANVVLGLIDPYYFLGGRIKLDKGLAIEAVGRIAAQLGIGLQEAAYAIQTASNHNMVAAIEDITIREGLNPRDSYFVCGGGATACHVAEMVDILGLKRYMIPKFTAGLSAFGGLISDMRWEASATLFTIERNFNADAVNAALRRLLVQADAFLDGARVPKELRRFEYAFMGRYEYQSWEIEVDFELQDGSVNASMVPDLVEAFHRMHERIYSIRNEGDKVEFTTWRVRAIGKRPNQDNWKQYTLADHKGPVEAKGHRPVYVHTGQSGSVVDIPVFEHADLGAKAEFVGPAILEASTFSAFIKPGHSVQIDARGNALVAVA
jgi:N-methylhydantoinase A